MKLIVNCNHCALELHKEIMKSIQPITVTAQELLERQILVDIVDDNIYHFRCKRGHDNIMYLDNLKFEILYESGINAMLDGYFAESILTITAAIERAYEFFIENISYKNEIDPILYKSTFNLVATQSERQLGAFYFLYLNTLKKLPPFFDTKLVTFRNKVTHKGYIPKFEETEKYARAAFDFIKGIFIDVVEFIGETSHRQYHNIRYQNAIPKLKELHSKYNSPQGSMSLNTILCHMLVLELYKKQEYDTLLEELKRQKRKQGN